MPGKGAYKAPATLHADFSRRVVVNTNELPWLPSPQAGVERRLLDRIGSEVARATSVVRYANNSTFPAHTHGAGEEFLVLEGTFCDEHGTYPAGTYVRNPPGSEHAPFTEEGCVILVKLRQMRESGEPQTVRDTNAMQWTSNATGCDEKLLFDAFGDEERVTLTRLAAGSTATHRYPGGEELYLLEGSISLASDTYRAGTWFRIPDGDFPVWSTENGCVFWHKRGHLTP